MSPWLVSGISVAALVVILLVCLVIAHREQQRDIDEIESPDSRRSRS